MVVMDFPRLVKSLECFENVKRLDGKNNYLFLEIFVIAHQVVLLKKKLFFSHGITEKQPDFDRKDR